MVKIALANSTINSESILSLAKRPCEAISLVMVQSLHLRELALPFQWATKAQPYLADLWVLERLRCQVGVQVTTIG